MGLWDKPIPKITGYKTEAMVHLQIQLLYDYCLKDDDYWHFFFEPNCVYFRIDSDRELIFEGALKEYEIEFEKMGPWEKDNIPITAKYQKQFQQMFHAFSELAILAWNDEVEAIDENTLFFDLFDRVTHCYLNMLLSTEMVKKLVGSLGKGWGFGFQVWEPIVLQKMATIRAFGEGHRWTMENKYD